MRALLDVNVLIALLDSAHVHHALARAWLERELARGWASCPITQNGCVRIQSSPAYPGHFPPAEVAARLAKAISHPAHAFWPDDVNLLDQASVAWDHILGHRQITDAYLLALEVSHRGCFVTFDQRIGLAAVPGARDEHLVVLGRCEGHNVRHHCLREFSRGLWIPPPALIVCGFRITAQGGPCLPATRVA